jgi:uncharacterized protein YjbI with pentapeptide repeats
MKYLQKIVQIPYTTPLWNPPSLSDTITSMIKETHLPKNVIEKVLDPKMQELIIKATELNPRDVKRFINSIVISHEIYGQKINDIEKIIVIQAFYFHGDKWTDFLKLLIPYKQRIEFGMHFISWLEEESTTIFNLYDLNKILQDDKNLEKDDYVYKSLADKSLLHIYKKLIDIGDNDLFSFLRVSIETFLRIDKIERYLRVLDPIGTTSKAEKFLDLGNEKQLDLLLNRQVREFNNYVEQGILIHLPFEKLARCDLQNFHLKGSMLFRADLSEANLSRANLVGANLVGADLTRVNLRGAFLSEADLTRAILPGADLYEADLYEANLSEAFLWDADLSEADLSEASLAGASLLKADLTGADLSDANLYGADLTGANLSMTKLLNTIILNCKFANVIVDKYTDFSDSIISDPDFLKHLREKGSRNIPDGIKNKKELRERLQPRVSPKIINFYLSQLPEI